MKKNGFTLVETIVILGLLSILIILAVTSVGDFFYQSKIGAKTQRNKIYIDIINNYLADKTNDGITFDTGTTYYFNELALAGYIKSNECDAIAMKKIDLETSYFKVRASDAFFKVDSINIKTTSEKCDNTEMSPD